MSTDDFYAREADRIARGPQFYGGVPSIIALRCFKRYHRDATADITDGYGLTRWLATKQARVHAIVLRMAVDGQRATMRQIAAEAMCSPGTVSRTLVKLQAWGVVAADVLRGRHGGVWVRKFTDDLESYAVIARQKLRNAIRKARSVNVASGTAIDEAWTSKDMQELDTYLLTKDATFPIEHEMACVT